MSAYRIAGNDPTFKASKIDRPESVLFGLFEGKLGAGCRSCPDFGFGRIEMLVSGRCRSYFPCSLRRLFWIVETFESVPISGLPLRDKAEQGYALFCECDII